MEFRDEHLLEALNAATPEQLDALQFGVVRMDLHGVVDGYNRFESNLSGLSVDRVVGKPFFEQVAPCTNNYMVAERFAGDSLDEQIDYVFTYKMKPTKVRLRLLKSSPSAEHRYLLVEKP
jgi:photoactive yellow protein